MWSGGRKRLHRKVWKLWLKKKIAGLLKKGGNWKSKPRMSGRLSSSASRILRVREDLAFRIPLERSGRSKVLRFGVRSSAREV